MKGKIRRLAALITNNFGIKLLAVIVSMGLWFVVNNITDPVEKVKFNNIAVEILNADAITSNGKVYEIIDNTGTVNVEVSGKRSVLSYITRDNIKATADMEQLTIMNTIGIEVTSTRNNSDLEFKTSIDSVKLSIEDVKRVQMIINVSTSGEPADGYVVGSVSTSQNIVQISGPESVVEQIDHVEAVTDISGYSSDISASVDLKLYDADGNSITSSSLSMNITSVNVSVTILATKEIPLEFTITGEPAEGYIANGVITSNPTTVTLAGRKSVLDAITKLSISDSALNIDGQTGDFTTSVNIKKYLPSNTQFADSSYSGNVNVTVGVEPLVSKTLNIPANNFAAGFSEHELPDGWEAVISEFEDRDNATYRVIISGTQEAVDAVSAADVIGVVDMDAIYEELGLDEWAEGSYTGEIVFNFNISSDLSVAPSDDYMLTVELRELAEENENGE